MTLSTTSFWLIKAKLAGVYPVHVQPDAGIVHVLGDVHFANVGERPETGGQFLRESEVPLQVRTADLHIDESGHARVDDRVHHRAALEEGAHIRQLRGNRSEER